MIWRQVTRFIRPIFKWGGILSLTIFSLVACSLVEIEDAPLTTFEPAGPFAERIDAIFWQVFWIATVIFVIVEGGILLIVLLFRDRKGRKEPKQIHGNNKLEITWTIIPALILTVIAVPTIRGVFELTECGDDAMPVEIIGHQWWFEYRYPGLGIETGSVLAMPIDREICAYMTSADVLHNYWVPHLMGKRYLVPGQETTLKLQADEPAEYWGHCAEFCGLSHSLMRARVVSMTQEDFDAWVAAQQQLAIPPEPDTPAAAGLKVFQEQGCTQCHTVDYGPDYAGTNLVADEFYNGPNLTHFASRNVFAGAILPREGQSRSDGLREWLANPPAVKPGSFMPNLDLTHQEIEDLIAWLDTLQ